MRLFKMWGFSVWLQSYWKGSVTAPVVTEEPTLAVCGVPSIDVLKADLWQEGGIILALILGLAGEMWTENKQMLAF